LINREELGKKVKFIAQEAWRVEVNTTINSIVEYITIQSLNYLLDELENQPCMCQCINKDLKYGEDGRHQISERITETKSQRPRSNHS
jgi:hypothetical protein